MSDSYFTFKQFRVLHRKSIMKVGTDGVLLGAYVDCKDAATILDIGTGTGLLCLMLAQKSNAVIHGIDINEEAVDVANINVCESKWNDRITIIESSVQDFLPDIKYDLIVSNPPFYTTDVVAPVKGRALARHDIGLSSCDLAISIERLLSANGRCYVIYPTAQAEIFEAECRGVNLFVKSKLLVSSRCDTEPIRTILELGRQEVPTIIDTLSIENNARHDFSEKYREITRDYYLKF